jgi:tetratricopeptide (TPR) repeat protein
MSPGATQADDLNPLLRARFGDTMRPAPDQLCSEVPMKSRYLVLVLLLAMPLSAQITTISFAAGSPEDQATQAIANEQDAQKRLTMWNDFVEKFGSNPQAVAYGNSQIAQQYSASGDVKQALAYSEKAVAAQPNNIDMIMAAVNAAQQAKDSSKVIEYACKGGALYNQVGKSPKPADMSDADFATQNDNLRSSLQQTYDFFEVAAFNAIAGENDAKLRMNYVDAFTPAFPKSKFTEQVAQYAIVSLQQLSDSSRLAAYGEKALAADPDNASTLVLLATAFSEDQKSPRLDKATQYARRAIELSKTGTPESEPKRKLTEGAAHSALGYALLREEKTTAAVPELKEASLLLKGDQAAYSTVLYRLGYAYAKLNRVGEARAVLSEAAAIQGPFQQPSKELLAKIAAVRRR